MLRAKWARTINGSKSKTHPARKATSPRGLYPYKLRTENQTMETETPKAAPILEIAWTRYANLNSAAVRRTASFYSIRRWIIILGVLATFLAIMTEVFFSDPTYSPFPGYKI